MSEHDESIWQLHPKFDRNYRDFKHDDGNWYRQYDGLRGQLLPIRSHADPRTILNNNSAQGYTSGPEMDNNEYHAVTRADRRVPTTVYADFRHQEASLDWESQPGAPSPYQVSLRMVGLNDDANSGNVMKAVQTNAGYTTAKPSRDIIEASKNSTSAPHPTATRSHTTGPITEAFHPPSISRTNSQAQTQQERRKVIESGWAEDEVEVYSYKRNKNVPATAKRDTQANKNFISKSFLEAELRDQKRIRPPTQTEVHGFGGSLPVEGVVELKFRGVRQELGKQVYGEVRRGSFHIVDSKEFGDMLLGSQFLQKNDLVKFKALLEIREKAPKQTLAEDVADAAECLRRQTLSDKLLRSQEDEPHIGSTQQSNTNRQDYYHQQRGSAQDAQYQQNETSNPQNGWNGYQNPGTQANGYYQAQNYSTSEQAYDPYNPHSAEYTNTQVQPDENIQHPQPGSIEAKQTPQSQSNRRSRNAQSEKPSRQESRDVRRRR